MTKSTAWMSSLLSRETRTRRTTNAKNQNPKQFSVSFFLLKTYRYMPVIMSTAAMTTTTTAATAAAIDATVTASRDFAEQEYWATQDLECDSPNCAVKDPQFCCAKCQCTYYCSQACQKQDFPTHKKMCPNFQQLTKASLQTTRIFPNRLNEHNRFSNQACVCGLRPITNPIPMNCYDRSASGGATTSGQQQNHALCPKCYQEHFNKHCPLCLPTATPLTSFVRVDRPSLDRVILLRVDQCMSNACNPELSPEEQRDQNESAIQQLSEKALSGNNDVTMTTAPVSFSGIVTQYSSSRVLFIRRLLQCRLLLLQEEKELHTTALGHATKLLTVEIPNGWQNIQRQHPLSAFQLSGICREISETGTLTLPLNNRHETTSSSGQTDDTTLVRLLTAATLLRAECLERLNQHSEAHLIYQNLSRTVDPGTLQLVNSTSFLRDPEDDPFYRKDETSEYKGIGETYQATIAMGLTRSVLAIQADHDDGTLTIPDIGTFGPFRRCPGVHRTAAMALKTRGDMEGALNILKRAFLYEEPWNTRNTELNRKFNLELTENIRQAEELASMEEEFMSIWGGVIEAIDSSIDEHNPVTTWFQIKQRKYDMMDQCGELDASSSAAAKTTDQVLSDAQAKAVQVTEEAVTLENITRNKNNTDDDSADVFHDAQETDPDEYIVDYGDIEDAAALTRIFMTKDVMKWRDRSDNIFLELFVKKITCLANGERGGTRAKGLKGSTNRIFETYLENSIGGHRILWTEDPKHGLIIWYVCHHDKVSRKMELIDAAERRSNRQQQMTAAAELPEFGHVVMQDGRNTNQDLDANAILLDPSSDTPLKLYEINDDDISRLNRKAWKPRLHLTTEEHEIVKTNGTVCLLGRSGTGKTVCIACRIQYERETAPFTDHSFRQLFVARSNRICTYVEETVGKELDSDGNPLPDSRTTYMKFAKLIETLEQTLDDTNLPAPRKYLDAMHIDFGRFKRDFCKDDFALDALLIWAQIRTFIKGSVDAVVNERPLTKDEYLALGEKECRINQDQRNIAYTAFEAYEKFLKSTKQWDDCDQMTSLVRRLRNNRGVCQTLSYSRLYVDEIQDYTQVEIALFFLLCSRGGLFLAGDPAQSVVQGVDFRFEHIRIVAHKLFDAKERGKYIPAKPTHVTRNFRSHKGILDLAAAVLERLFAVFPGSAKELGADEGVFTGPRPGIFEGVKDKTLKELTQKIDGGVLLTMYDSEVERLTKLVDNKKVLVLSIRDSKGLEWSNVILVDFFASLENEHQIPWRKLFQAREEDAIKPGFPEIEGQLKQLYTAITRCSRRLFIAETQTSESGKALVRWLCSNDLAGRQNVEDVEKMIMTSDEWCTTGITYASEVESESELDKIKFWLEKALNCFEQAEDEFLISKAKVHQSAVSFREHLETIRAETENGVHAPSLLDQAPDILQKLIDENLLNEAVKICKLILPHFDGTLQTWLKERIMNRVPTSN